MMHIKKIVKDENGSLMVIGLLLLVLISFIGIASINFSSTELEIARNDLLAKSAFYSADGALELSSELLEQNIASQTGFDGAVVDGETKNYTTYGTGDFAIEVWNLNFWDNDALDENAETIVSDSVRDLSLPADYGDKPHTNIKIGGTVRRADGAPVIMVSGYEGKGKASAQGGTYLDYTIYSQHEGNRHSSSTVALTYRHVVGQE